MTGGVTVALKALSSTAINSFIMELIKVIQPLRYIRH